MIELKTPIRLYWDVAAGACASGVESICRDLVDLRILSLNITLVGPGGASDLLHLLGILKGKGPRVAVSLSGEDFSFEVCRLLKQTGVANVLMCCDSLRDLEEHFHLPPGTDAEKSVGISFDVTPLNWRELPDVVAFCIDKRIGSLTLPMQRLVGEPVAFYLSTAEAGELAAMLRDKVSSELKLTIHDPFLWRVFFPDIPFPDGGCQAANTMAYISPEGDVYPCPSLPVSLGKISPENSLKEILLSSAKAEARQRILRYPAGCSACTELGSCKGGCRGRGLVAAASFDTPDPACGYTP